MGGREEPRSPSLPGGGGGRRPRRPDRRGPEPALPGPRGLPPHPLRRGSPRSRHRRGRGRQGRRRAAVLADRRRPRPGPAGRVLAGRRARGRHRRAHPSSPAPPGSWPRRPAAWSCRGCTGTSASSSSPPPSRVQVVEVVPPEPPKLLDQARRVLEVAEDLPPSSSCRPWSTSPSWPASAGRPVPPALPGIGHPAGRGRGAVPGRAAREGALGAARLRPLRELHRWFYGEEAETVDLCPRRVAARAGGATPVLTKCCLLEEHIERDGTTVTVPWGASLDLVGRAATRCRDGGASVVARLTDSEQYAHLWGTEELRAVFEERRRLQSWLDILVALAAAQAELGIIPADAAAAIASAASVDRLDLGFVAAETRRTSHSTLGLIRGLQRVLPPEAGEHIYYGGTVQDVTDTWTALAMRSVGEVVGRDLDRIRGCWWSWPTATGTRSWWDAPTGSRGSRHLRAQGGVLGRRGRPAPGPAAPGRPAVAGRPARGRSGSPSSGTRGWSCAPGSAPASASPTRASPGSPPGTGWPSSATCWRWSPPPSPGSGTRSTSCSDRRSASSTKRSGRRWSAASPCPTSGTRRSSTW